MPRVLGGIQKWKTPFNILFYLWIVGASKEKKILKNLNFKLRQKWIENSLKSSVKTWRTRFTSTSSTHSSTKALQQSPAQVMEDNTPSAGINRCMIIPRRLNQNQSLSTSGLTKTHSPSVRCLKSQQYGKKGEDTRWDYFSQEVVHRANSRCVCYWIKAINLWNECNTLGLGDVCPPKSGGSSLLEKPQNTLLFFWLHGLGCHLKNHIVLKSGK